MLGVPGIVYALGVLAAGLGQGPMDVPLQTPPSASASIQQQDEQGAPNQIEDVEVIGRSSDTVQALVRELTQTNGHDGQLGRFDRQVCPGVVNMSTEEAEVILSRISAAATAVGLRVGRRDCNPNLIVFATDDASSVPQLIDAYPAIFGRHARNVNDGRQALTAFLNSSRPVRWWHVSNLRPAGGEARGGGWIRQPSLFKLASRVNIEMAVLVVDFSKFDTVNLSALGDYLAFVGLARINPDADVAGADTILNLFSEGSDAPDEMTALDRNYLTALYRMSVDTRRHSQESEIAQRIVRPTDAQ